MRRWCGMGRCSRQRQRLPILALLLMLVLGGCGGQGDAQQGIEEAQSAFLLALRNNDREGVLRLTAVDQQA